jgi:hypothetical protein
MRRIICIALFGLLLSSEADFAQHGHFVTPQGSIFVSGPRYRWHPRMYYYHQSHHLDPFRYFVQDFTTPYTAAYQSIVPFQPTYFFLPSQSSIHPQLIFKDGTTYTVADYWRIDDQLHFITSEEGGTKSVPHAVSFGELDVQRTTGAAEAQGFRFVIRDEPIDQWLQHHPRQTSSTSKSKRRTRERLE